MKNRALADQIGIWGYIACMGYSSEKNVYDAFSKECLSLDYK